VLLLTCYLRFLLTSTFRLREPSTIRALRPRFSPVRPTSAALAARTTPAALSCSTFWVLWCPDLDARAPHGSLPILQLGSCMTDLCSLILPRDPLLLFSPGCCPERNRASTICLTGWDHLTKPLGRMVQSLPGDHGMRRPPRPQSSVLAALGFSPARVFPKDARF
jgi:hypothetical protein